MDVVISSPPSSSSSDKQLWDTIRDRVDSILYSSSVSDHDCNHLLMKGFDSLDSSLLLLSTTLSAAQQGVSDLAKPCLAKVRQRESAKTEDEPEAKRPRGFDKFTSKQESGESEKLEGSASHGDEHNEFPSPRSPIQEVKKASSTVLQSGTLKKAKNEVKKASSTVLQSGTLKKAKNLASSMATKASFLTRELKSIKAELCFMHERCNLLEEENRRLREGFEKGARPEEDDLVRLQLEALLAEKSRLANDNANLIRENQCLHQLVEYHQLTAQDLSASYDQLIHGTCLDFSSALEEAEDNKFDQKDNINDVEETPCTPSKDQQ